MRLGSVLRYESPLQESVLSTCLHAAVSKKLSPPPLLGFVVWRQRRHGSSATLKARLACPATPRCGHRVYRCLLFLLHDELLIIE